SAAAGPSPLADGPRFSPRPGARSARRRARPVPSIADRLPSGVSIMLLPWISVRAQRPRQATHGARHRGRAPLHLEALEDRALPSVLTVNKLFDAGPGTLRQALLDANSSTGPDTIRFAVGGTINLQTQLPALNDSTGGILIDGTTAPGFGTVPLITLHGPGTG